MTVSEFIISLFKDERGSISIKPVVALIGALFLCGCMLFNCFKPSMKLDSNLINSVMIITTIGMGADSLDKFSLKKKDETTTVV